MTQFTGFFKSGKFIICARNYTNTYKLNFKELFFFLKRKKVVKNYFLFLFVTISASTFFTLVRCYLVSFTFFTTWHKLMLFKINIQFLFYFYIGFYTFYKYFCRFKCRDIMSWNFNGSIF